MLTIEKEKKIRNLISQDFSDREVAGKTGVSRSAVRRIRETVNTVKTLHQEEIQTIKKLFLSGLSVESIEKASKKPRVVVEAVKLFFFLQTRKYGEPINRCPTCGAMMFSVDHGARMASNKKIVCGLSPEEISEEQAKKLYQIVWELCELNRYCIITNPLFYYLARRAEKALRETNDS